MALGVKNLLVEAGDAGSILGGGSLGGGHGYPLQCSCLENPMDRGTWRATVHRVKRETLEGLSTRTYSLVCVADSFCCTAETSTTF